MILAATQRRAGSSAGFTLVESVVAAVLFSGVMLTLGLAMDSAFGSYRMAEAESRLDQAAHRALDQILANLEDAGAGTLGAPTGAFGSSSLTFRRAASYDADGGAIDWGEETTVAWQLEEGELDDDLDNDGDGLVDEGEIVWTIDVGGPSERTVTRVRGVPQNLDGEEPNLVDDNGNGLIDEAGLDFEWDGTVLTVRLSLTAIGPRGVVLTKTVRTATRLRN